MSKQGTVRVLTAVIGAACALAISACGKPPDDSAARAQRSAMSAMDAGGVRAVQGAGAGAGVVAGTTAQPEERVQVAQPTAIGGGPAVGTGAARSAACNGGEAGLSDPDCDEAGVRAVPGPGPGARIDTEAPVTGSETNGECPPGTNMNEP